MDLSILWILLVSFAITAASGPFVIPYLRKLIKEHKLKGKFLGRHYIVSDEELKRFVNSLGVKNER